MWWYELVLSIGVAAVPYSFIWATWKWTKLGYNAHRDVTKFLVDHGAQIDRDIIVGGPVMVPMRTIEAANCTIRCMLDIYPNMIRNHNNL